MGQFEFDTGERRHESKDRSRIGDSFGIVVRGRSGPGRRMYDRCLFFPSYFSGGPNANCTIADKTILGISQNEVAEPAGVLVNGIFGTPADDPGIEFVLETTFFGANGASFVFSVTAPSSSSINGVSLSVGASSDGSATVTGSLSNGDSLSASLGETSSLNFDPTHSLTVTLSQASSGDDGYGEPSHRHAVLGDGCRPGTIVRRAGRGRSRCERSGAVAEAAGRRIQDRVTGTTASALRGW